MDDHIKNPIWLLAAGGAIGLAVFGLLAGLAQLAPALGTMWSIATTGAAAGFSVAPAWGAVAAYGTAATGAARSIHLVVKITREAKKEPLIWGTPILGVLSGFLVQICEQFWSGSKIVWLGFSLVAGLLVIIGGVFYAQKQKVFKIIGAATSVIAPAVVLASIAHSQTEPLFKFLLTGSLDLWLPLLLLLLAAVILGALAHVSANRQT